MGLYELQYVLNRGKSAILPLFNDPEVLSFASDGATFVKNVSRNPNFDNWGISLIPTSWTFQCVSEGNLFCDGVMLEIYLDHKFQWPRESLNYESLACEVVT